MTCLLLYGNRSWKQVAVETAAPLMVSETKTGNIQTKTGNIQTKTRKFYRKTGDVQANKMCSAKVWSSSKLADTHQKLGLRVCGCMGSGVRVYGIGSAGVWARVCGCMGSGLRVYGLGYAGVWARVCGCMGSDLRVNGLRLASACV
jgi:hypothetical protein